MSNLDPNGPAAPHAERLGRTPVWAHYERQITEDIYEYETKYLTRATLFDLAYSKTWHVRIDPVNYDAIRITLTRKETK